MAFMKKPWVIATITAVVALGLAAWLLGRMDLRERVLERAGKPGYWRLERAGTSGFWRWLNSIGFVSRWLTDRGYEGERWWYVSPAGKRTFLTFLNGATPDGRDADAAAFVPAAIANARAWGFGALGHGVPAAAWAPHGEDMPAVISLSLNTWNAGLAQGVFEDWYGPAVVKACEAGAAAAGGSRTVAGILWEATPSLSPRALFLAYAALKPESASRARVTAFLREACRSDPRALSARLPSVRSFEELAARTGLDQYEGIDQDAQAFARLAYAAYGAKVQQEVRARFPNYLNLGPLLDPVLPVAVVQALAAYVDVLTFASRSGDGRVPRRYLEDAAAATGKPVLLLETGARLETPGAPAGDGPVVRTPEGLARALRRSFRGAAALPFVAGAGWASYRDTASAAGGFLDAASAVRPPLVAAAIETLPPLDELHKAGLPEAERPEHFADDRFAGPKPAQSIPRLPAAFAVDGTLGEWPREAARLKALTPVHDLDAAGFAELFAGWNDEGLAIAAEVTDETSELLDPGAYWREADFVEIVVEAAGRRDEGYAPTSLHLALLPRGGGPDGSGAVAVVVHHDGDAVKPGGALPAPVRAAGTAVRAPGEPPGWRPSCKIAPPGWRIEALVPWKAFGIAAHPELTLGFNAVVRRVSGRRAEDMCWALPRGEAGLDHPSAWGTLTLGAAP